MKKRLYFVDIVAISLLGACFVLATLLCLMQPWYLLIAAVIILIGGAAIVLRMRAIRKLMARILHGKGYTNGDSRYSLAQLKIPVLVLSGDTVLWYNDAFVQDVLAGEDLCFAPVGKLLPGFDKLQIDERTGQDLLCGNARFTVYGSGVQMGKNMFVAYFIENTQLKQQAEEYAAIRPSVMMIALDTYDDLTRDLRESERARLSGDLELVLEQFIGTTTGFLRRISASKYIAVVEERHMQEILRNRFSVLDAVRALGEKSGVMTLSVGVGHKGESLRTCVEMAEQALDMALGRGGDQAAVKSESGYEFYGGVSRSVERHNKVRSRIIASALRDLILQSAQVLILGHRASDLDCVGAAAGIWRICRMCDKPAAIVVDERQSLAANLIEELRADGCDFVRPEGVENNVQSDTLVVIVDTHLAHLLENPAVYNNAKQVVVIDHHRRCVGYIENATIFYHEPSASSASELVTELLQYIDAERDKKMTPAGAQALLAGIMLDTRNFALHTGVRTFEAAAYLRRMGARTIAVKKLFNSSFESYAYKAQLVTDAEIYMGCAVVATDSLPHELSVVVPQAANDLLTIDGVEASFVAVALDGQVNISARSMGEVNVQIIMERLGGGGHLTMAGTQIRDTTLELAKQKLLDAITEYRENAVALSARAGK